MTLILDATRERFLRAVIAKVPAESIEEVHFFQPMKQGGVESGVAVIAAVEAPPAISAAAFVPDAGADPETGEAPPAPAPAEADAGPDEPAPPESGHERRITVYTARYRLVLKGPDRGKWEAQVTPEADAPLLTVETVVRGVQHRAGDVDAPERVSGDDIRAALAKLAG